jgi:hypothetical protein
VRTNKSKLKRALKRVKRQLATLDVSGTPAGAAVTVNSKPVGNLPLGKVRVTGGSLTVHAKKDGYLDYESVLDLPPGAVRAIRIEMDTAPPPVIAAPVVAPAPAPVEAVPALAEPAPKPAEPPVVAQAQPKSTQTDFEAETEPQPEVPAEEPSATGFEMALNFGYQPWIGGPKTNGNSGVLAPQIVLGARFLWPLSFGLQLNGGFDTGTAGTSFVGAANPGLYVRGHLQRYKRMLGWDAWAGVGLQPIAMQFAVLKAKTVDPNSIDLNSLNTNSTQAAAARAMYGVDSVHTLQSLNLPFELGGAFYFTESFGLDLAAALTLWLPQQSCLHNGTDRLCVESGLKSQTSLWLGGGLIFLP